MARGVVGEGDGARERAVEMAELSEEEVAKSLAKEVGE